MWHILGVLRCSCGTQISLPFIISFIITQKDTVLISTGHITLTTCPIITIIALHSQPTKNTQIMKWVEIIKESAWVVEDILTPEECQQFMGDVRHRNSNTVFIDNQEMAQRIYERIKDFIPQEVTVDENCQNDGLRHSKEMLYGTWRPSGLNERWRVACYPGFGHFGPHRDGCRVIDENHRSLMTINGYLTDRPLSTGGATRFIKDSLDLSICEIRGIYTAEEEDVLYKVESDKKGKAVVFFHDLMHDGEPLKEGSAPKWLFRTEILFRRDPDTAPQLTENQIQAREFLKQAEAAEEGSNFAAAIKYYNKAYKLDSTLE